MREQNQEIERAAYSPSEFAAACGRHATYAYRLLYAGKIKAVSSLGRLLIPASELSRVMATAERYNPKPKKRKADAAEPEGAENATS